MDTPSPPPTTTTATDDQIHHHPTTITLIPKQLPPPFTNGVLKRHKLRHHHHHPPPVVVAYKECLKNHAASIGGHAVDGCGEFMPSPAATPADPTSIKCAACGCHRNFHRRDPDASFPINPSPPVQHVIDYQPHHRHHPPPPQPPPPPPQPISVAGVLETSVSPPDSPSPPPISSSYMLLALSSGLSAPPPEITRNPQISTGIGAIGANSTGKKRFRTKFTQDQKQKMHELAERVGWKMQKKDEDLIINFCNEIGVDKGVFKVWMHNNKMTFAGKKDSGHQLVDSGSSGGGGGGGGGGGDFLMSRNYHHLQQQQNNDSGSSGGGGGGGGGGDGGGDVIGTNGSSSSS